MMSYKRPTVGQIAAYSVLAGIVWVIFIVVGFWKAPQKSVENTETAKAVPTWEREDTDVDSPKMSEKI